MASIIARLNSTGLIWGISLGSGSNPTQSKVLFLRDAAKSFRRKFIYLSPDRDTVMAMIAVAPQSVKERQCSYLGSDQKLPLKGGMKCSFSTAKMSRGSAISLETLA